MVLIIWLKHLKSMWWKKKELLKQILLLKGSDILYFFLYFIMLILSQSIKENPRFSNPFHYKLSLLYTELC